MTWPTRLARFFLVSRLTPLFIIGPIAAGSWGILTVPREDEPVVEVPSVAVTIPFPAAGAEVADARVGRPVQGWLLEIDEVASVTSIAEDDRVLFSLEFDSGTSDAEAFALVDEALRLNRALLPEPAGEPTIRLVGREDVPALTLALWSESLEPWLVRRVAAELAVELGSVEGVRETVLFGGDPRVLSVELDALRLTSQGVNAGDVVDAIRAANVELPADAVSGLEGRFRVEAGTALRTPGELGAVVVGGSPAGPVHLTDVATIRDRPREPDHHLLHATKADAPPVDQPAVVLAVINFRRAQASTVNARVLDRIDELRDSLLTEEVAVEVLYDRGADVERFVRDVFKHLFLATIIVIAIVGFWLGWRAGILTLVVIPVSLSLVPLVYHAFGFTINPVSVGAMILAIGILADDAVIIVENIYRYAGGALEPTQELVLKALDEVARPVILANLIIVAALMPMAFLPGEMGQYLRAIPVGASSAVLFSLISSLIIAPYVMLRLRRRDGEGGGDAEGREEEDLEEAADRVPEHFRRPYRRILTPFLDRPAWRWALYAGCIVLLGLSMALIPLRKAGLDLAPTFDATAFIVEIELPRGSTLEETAAAVADAGALLRTLPEVESHQSYIGLVGPPIFPHLVQIEDMLQPRAVNRAEIHVQLLPEAERRRKSLEITRVIRPELEGILAPRNARLRIEELRGGPATRATLAAEVYGPTGEVRHGMAREVEGLFRELPELGDFQRTPEEGMPRIRIQVEPELAALFGVAPLEVARTAHIALAGETAGQVRLPFERAPVPIQVRIGRGDRIRPADVEALSVVDARGNPVPLVDMARIVTDTTAPSVRRRDLLPVVDVRAEIVVEGLVPLFVQIDLQEPLRSLEAPDGTGLEIHWFNRPGNADRPALFWSGDWELTFTVYRDLGITFLVVLLLIYVIMVAWFRSFLVPVIIMLPIPLTLIGVVPAHWLYGVPLTGPSIMGVIALAGVSELDSLLLVDFIRNRRARGMGLRDAVLLAGAARTQPILLTRLTFVFGAGTLVLERSLEGMGLAMASGAVASTLLTLVVVPVLYMHVYEGSEDEGGTPHVQGRG